MDGPLVLVTQILVLDNTGHATYRWNPDLYHQYSRYLSRLGRLHLHSLQCTLALRPMVELSSTVMSSAESRSQHAVEGKYCSQYHDHCHALGGKCPAFSSYSFAALMLHDVVIEPL